MEKYLHEIIDFCIRFILIEIKMTDIDKITKKIVNDPDYVTCLNENEISDCLEKIKTF